jgi:uncharacterized protein (DUF2236 family)
MSKLTFADRATALLAARSVERSHRRVRGQLSAAVGRFAAGTPYDGRDPELVRWVWATLVDTSLLVYELFVGALAPEAREAYYQGQRVLARLLGVPAPMVPPTLAEFRAYFDAMIASDALGVGAQGRDIADAVLDPPGGMADAATVRLLTTALLPPRLRDEFALPWGASHEHRFAALRASVLRLRDESRASAGVAGTESVS